MRLTPDLQAPWPAYPMTTSNAWCTPALRKRSTVSRTGPTDRPILKRGVLVQEIAAPRRSWHWLALRWADSCVLDLEQAGEGHRETSVSFEARALDVRPDHEASDQARH